MLFSEMDTRVEDRLGLYYRPVMSQGVGLQGGHRDQNNPC